MKRTRSDEYLWRLTHWRFLPMSVYLEDFKCNTVNCHVAGWGALTYWAPLRNIYPDFLGWWRRVGRVDPNAKDHWGHISGPWAGRDKPELITPEEWATVPEDERVELREWFRVLPGMIFYD